ncbi:phosphonoacetaldehyde hydrolase [Chitinibacteraceae bacterium HSL-7]
MTYQYTRRYTGRVEAVVFDWAGTLVDFGSFAPTQVLVDAFETVGVPITLAEARGPMGMAKWDHIRALGNNADIARRWQQHFGSAMSDADVDRLYAIFMPLQIERVGAYSTPVPGALATLAWLREAGICIGSCTGYPRAVVDAMLPEAHRAGIRPECVIAADDLAAGARPGPWMALANVIELGIGHVAACVKVDDTAVGIAEGLNAGMWTVGLAVSGNEVGLPLSEWQALSATEQTRRRTPAAQRLAQAGAHFVIDTVAELPAIIDEINARLAHGEQP